MQCGSEVWAWTGQDAAFERGKVDRVETHKGVVHVKLANGKIVEAKDDTVHLANNANQDGVADNTELRQLNEATLLHNIRERYAKGEGGCYTVTGHILIAVNPFEQLGIYGEKQIKRYLSRPIGSEPPHIYAIADRMYRLLVASGENQAIIVSGPSGAGKTETCKLVLRHLAYVTKDSLAQGSSKSSMELGELLVRTNPLLEAFGNAETILNKNSSRFGKFTQIHVSRRGAILGASIQTYLLESTRVVQHAVNECTYHINYQLVTGLTAGDRQKHLVDADANTYSYLRSSSGKATGRRGKDEADFQEVRQVLKSIGVGTDLQYALFQTMSGLIHLGNITLAEGSNSETVVTNTTELKNSSKLLCTHEALLQQGLTSRTMKLKGSEMQIPLKPDEARSSRDALAKAIYGKLFGWVVQQVNNSLMDPNSKSSDAGFLGILDIYGFENFERNSLEQLFINFANERLHQHFAVALFKTEQEIYAREGIVCPVIEWEDNSECLEMISGKSPNSIFNALAEHSRLPKSSNEGMTEKLLADNRKSKCIFPPKLTSGYHAGGKGQRLTHKEAFVVTHFAGDVVYRTEGWLKKNTDTLHEDLQVCMSSSTSPILSKLFSIGTINAITGGARGGGKRAGYVAEKYARQLEDLMRTLRASHSHFVRCVKPNHQQEPHRFINDLVLSQLRNSGMVDAVRLLSAGYSTRLPFETLETQFKPLAPAKFQRLPANLFCVALLSAFDLGRSDFLLGLTKAFFKSGKLAFVDSLTSGQKKLDPAFFAKMGRLLALWRFRRGVSAVRCLIYLNAKMRRLRALWKFRRSASIASMIGSSWVRRTKEIRFGAAIERLQACGRGYLARRQKRMAMDALRLLQRMSRGHLGRVTRDTLRIEREKERKLRAKAERERKVRERQEAMEAKEKGVREAVEASDAVRREKLRVASSKVKGPNDKLTRGATSAAAAEPKPMAFKRKNLADDANGTALGAEELDGDESEGSDLLVADSDDEMGGDLDSVDIEGDGGDLGDGNASGIHNPRQLLAATAALDVRSSRGMSAAGMSNLTMPGVGEHDAGLERRDSFNGGLGRRTPSVLSRLKKQTAGRASGMFSSARRATNEDKKLMVSKTAKGSLVAASVMKVSKKTDGGWQERFVLVVGDVVFIFLLATQPEMPLGLRMWPERVVCLNQSHLSLQGAKPEVGKSGSDATFVVQAKSQGLGAQALLSDHAGTMERFATSMHLGVQNVRRSRQQAKLSLAQQMCHEKKLSLLKTQHMIELLHKSQEMFFEAGSGQFDDCNAVCMHSGVMRQSLIDVTPFMPVSDFICEYCSQVIVLEEQAQATEELADGRVEEHKQQLKREHSKKLQLDDETLMVARDVRVLRQRRKLAEEEAAGAWRAVERAMQNRQGTEQHVEELKLKQRLANASKAELDEVRAQLQEQVAAATKQCDMLAAQLEARQTRLAGARPEAEADPEEEILRATTARKMSFGKKAKGSGAEVVRKSSFSKKDIAGTHGEGGGGGGLTRVLSFGKKKKVDATTAGLSSEPSEGAAGESTKEQKRGGTGGLVRKLSFSKPKQKSTADSESGEHAAPVRRFSFGRKS